MKVRYTYAGVASLLLTLACGSKVEIGHGDGAGGGGGGGGVAGTSIDDGSGGTIQPGGTASTGANETGGTASTASAGYPTGGPIPIDNGPQKEVDKVDLLL